MRVVFFLRADAKRHVGGLGTGQVGQYAKCFRELGIDVTLWASDRDPPGRYDIGHIMNLDWPVEAARHAAAARRTCRHVVLFPIHHRKAWMEELHRAARGGLSARAARVMSLERFESLRGLTLAAQFPRQIPEALRQATLGVRRRQRAVLGAVDLCLPIAAGERRSLHEDFGFGGAVLEIRQGAQPGDGAAPPRGLPSEFLLCVGRVEARKNQLALLHAARALDLPVVLAGPPNTRHRAIVGEVERWESTSTALTWFRDLPRPQVLALYPQAACHVLPSWCEVVSQADLEAAIAGTRVVSTEHGHASEYLGADASQWNPLTGHGGLASVVAEALERPRPAADPGRFHIPRVAAELVRAYETVLAA